MGASDSKITAAEHSLSAHTAAYGLQVGHSHPNSSLRPPENRGLQQARKSHDIGAYLSPEGGRKRRNTSEVNQPSPTKRPRHSTIIINHGSDGVVGYSDQESVQRQHERGDDEDKDVHDTSMQLVNSLRPGRDFGEDIPNFLDPKPSEVKSTHLLQQISLIHATEDDTLEGWKEAAETTQTEAEREQNRILVNKAIADMREILDAPIFSANSLQLSTTAVEASISHRRRDGPAPWELYSQPSAAGRDGGAMPAFRGTKRVREDSEEVTDRPVRQRVRRDPVRVLDQARENVHKGHKGRQRILRESLWRKGGPDGWSVMIKKKESRLPRKRWAEDVADALQNL
jgi:hypothetical protein